MEESSRSNLEVHWEDIYRSVGNRLCPTPISNTKFQLPEEKVLFPFVQAGYAPQIDHLLQSCNNLDLDPNSNHFLETTEGLDLLGIPFGLWFKQDRKCSDALSVIKKWLHAGISAGAHWKHYSRSPPIKSWFRMLTHKEDDIGIAYELLRKNAMEAKDSKSIDLNITSALNQLLVLKIPYQTRENYLKPSDEDKMDQKVLQGKIQTLRNHFYERVTDPTKLCRDRISAELKQKIGELKQKYPPQHIASVLKWVIPCSNVNVDPSDPSFLDHDVYPDINLLDKNVQEIWRRNQSSDRKSSASSSPDPFLCFFIDIEVRRLMEGVTSMLMRPERAQYFTFRNWPLNLKKDIYGYPMPNAQIVDFFEQWTKLHKFPNSMIFFPMLFDLILDVSVKKSEEELKSSLDNLTRILQANYRLFPPSFIQEIGIPLKILNQTGGRDPLHTGIRANIWNAWLHYIVPKTTEVLKLT